MSRLSILTKIFAISSAFVIFSVLQYSGSTQTYVPVSQTVDRMQLKIGDGTVFVDIADTQSEHEKGLSGVRRLAEQAGVLFVFEYPDWRIFWNKDTFVPLDLVWIQHGVVVGLSSLPNVEIAGIVRTLSPEMSDQVLEVNRGWAKRNGVHVGSEVIGSQ
ncbi:MAG: DUF192 domain-containing protein [Patescibacteria group bacterium]|mgnify:CR=1 FL=1